MKDFLRYVAIKVTPILLTLSVAGCVAPVAPKTEPPPKMTYNPKLSAKANTVITDQGLDASEYFKGDDGCYYTAKSGGFELVFWPLADEATDTFVCD